MIITISLILIALAGLLAFIRLMVGPSSSDRLLATDTIATITTAAIAVLSVAFARVIYMDVAIVYAVLGFVGVVVVARHLEGGL